MLISDFFSSDCVLSSPVSNLCHKYLHLFPNEGSVRELSFHLHHITDVMWYLKVFCVAPLRYLAITKVVVSDTLNLECVLLHDLLY